MIEVSVTAKLLTDTIKDTLCVIYSQSIYFWLFDIYVCRSHTCLRTPNPPERQQIYSAIIQFYADKILGYDFWVRLVKRFGTSVNSMADEHSAYQRVENKYVTGCG